METSLLGLGPDWWNVAMLVMLGVVLLAGCLLAVAATGVIIVQRKESAAQTRSLEEYKVEATQKIAQARALASRAVERAASASERAVKLEKETEELRGRNVALQREETEKAAPPAAASVPVQPPTPSGEAFLAAVAKAPPGRADISYVRECASCLWLAEWLSSHLKEAGWHVRDMQPAAESVQLSAPAGQLAAVEDQTWTLTVLSRHASHNQHQKSEHPYDAFIAALSASLGRSAALSETKDEILAEDHVKVFIAARP